MKISTHHFVIIAFLVFACNNSTQNAFLDEIYTTLTLSVEHQYNEYQNIADPLLDIDSIYIIGNQLIENMDTPNFNELFHQFNSEYGRSIFHIKKGMTNSELKLLIKTIQYHILTNACLNFHKSHFQVDLIGLDARNYVIDAGMRTKIELIPYYTYSYVTPLVIINSDTLTYNKYNRAYEFDYFAKDTGAHIIDADIFVERWGETRKYKVGFCIDVK